MGRGHYNLVDAFAATDFEYGAGLVQAVIATDLVLIMGKMSCFLRSFFSGLRKCDDLFTKEFRECSLPLETIAR
jgi:hypothetical protein